MAAVNIRNVGKQFDSVVVMRNIDLDVADGEFIVLVGASGCGKSTLLRMIAGLEPITSGEIAIGGRRVNELEPRERVLQLRHRLQVHGRVVPDRGVRTAAGFDSPDALGRKRALPEQELGVLAGIDVVGHNGQAAAAREAAAKAVDQGRLARSDGTRDADTESSRHWLLLGTVTGIPVAIRLWDPGKREFRRLTVSRGRLRGK